ncbi:hypothetical protein FQU54_26405 [Salmonella enterica subsp. diarizonae]|nr:hypothetical protein [Salmonella enterica subsp. diarizonae]
MSFELWVDNVKILEVLEPDFKMNLIEDHEDLVIVEVERLSIEEKCALLNSLNKSYEVYLDKDILDELKSYSYVGISFVDDVSIMKIKVIKAVERDKSKQRIATLRKRYLFKFREENKIL